MRTKKMIRQLLSMMLAFTMVFISMAIGGPKQVQAAVNQKKLTSIGKEVNSLSDSSCMNASEKYLYLGSQGTKTYDFNIKKEAKAAGATYSWYVKTDKGNPYAVTINRKTGVVTAREAGTAYIRCKITLANGTVYRPEAKVTVRNNITAVEINNLPVNSTIPAGIATDFNYKVLDTDAGKDVKTLGIIRFEIKEDTAGVEAATTQGIVFPVKEGEFKIRAVCFQSTAKYKVWLSDKAAKKTLITAASEWAAIKVTSANGAATAATQEQLCKLLKADNITQITLSTEKAVTFVVPEGNYSTKNLIVNAANADVENHGVFKNITINAIKDSTWIEYANGNIVYLKDDAAGFIIDKDVDVKRIVIDKADSKLNIEINGMVEQIIVLQSSELTITGSGKQAPVSVEQTAGGSTITSAMSLKLELKAKTDIVLNQGAEDTVIDKSASDVVVKIENNTKKDNTITTNKSGGEAIGTGKTVISGGTGTAANQETIPPSGPSKVAVNGITVTSAGAAATVTHGGTLQMKASVAPENATNKTVTWSVINGTGSAAISADGLLSATGIGTVTVKALANDGSLKEGTKEITIIPTDLQKVAAVKSAIEGAAYTNLVVTDTGNTAQKIAAVQAVVDGVKGTTTAVVTISGANFSVAINLNEANATVSITTATFVLARVTNVALGADGVATWSNVSNEISYDVQLLKDGVKQGAVVNVAADTLTTNLLPAMRAAGAGVYTVTVTAKGDGVYYTNGPTSEASKAQTIIQLATVSAGLKWTGNVAKWTTVDHAVSYDVQLYKGGAVQGTPVNVPTANAAAGADFSAAITAAGAGTYTYTVTAKGNATLILDAAASQESDNNIKAAVLAQVTNVALGADGTVTWNNVSNETSFDVQLLKGGVKQGAAVNVAADTLTTNLLPAMRAAGAGVYTVIVTARGNGVYYTNGPASEASEAQTIIQLTAVNAGLNWTGDVAHWTAVANAVSYEVQLYKGVAAQGAPVNVAAESAAAGADFSAAITAAGAGTYTYTVTAKGNATLILDAAASQASDKNIKAAVLAQVTNVVLGADGKVTWNNVADETSFDVQLLKDGVKQGAVVNVTADTLTTNLLATMRAAGAGVYTVTVTAKGDGVYYTNGPASEASKAQTIIQLATVNDGLKWTGNVAKWTTVDHAVSYEVQLYKGGAAQGTPVNVPAESAAAGADFSAAITAAGAGTYTYKITAKGNSTLILNAVAASQASDNNIKAAALARVTNVALGADGKVTWNNVSNETSFDVQLLKGGVKQGAVVNVTADTLTTNLLAAMRAAGAGVYTVTVTAKGDGVYYSDGASSVASAAQTVIQLATISAGLNWTGDVAHWTTVTNAVSYEVQLYKGGAAQGTPVNVPAANAAAGADFSAAITAAGAGTYTYTVTAKGNATLILDAAASQTSDNNIKAAALAQVTNVALGADGIATWSNVSNEESYDVQLLKDGVKQGAVVNVAADTLTTNLLPAMRTAGAGVYTVTVTAKGNGVYYTNGPASEASEAQTIIRRATVNAGLNWNGDVAHWTAVANTVRYGVQLYKDGVAQGAPMIVLTAAVDFSAEITAAGAGTYTYTVIAKGNTTLILDAAASQASDNNIKAAALARVTNVALGADGKVTWNDVSNEKSFDVQLLRDGVKLGIVVNVAADTLTTNLLAAMRAAGTGVYTVTVTAKGDGVYYSDGAASLASAAQTVIRLATVNAGLNWTGDVAHWTTVTNAVSYKVQLFKEGVGQGTPVNVPAENAAAGADFSAAIKAAGAGNYAYTVTAQGDSTTLILDAVASYTSNNNKKAAVLAQVTNVALGADGKVTWNNVSNETSFDVQLLRGGVKLGAAVNIAADTLTTDLLVTMRTLGVGVYTVTVTAKGDGVYYTDGPVSAASAAQTIIRPATVSAGLKWTGFVAHWTAVTNAVSYDVQLYKGIVAQGTPVNVMAENAAAGADFSAAITAAGAGTYTYTVTAKGDGALICNALEPSEDSDELIVELAPPITGYTVAPGTDIGSTKITYIPGAGNSLRFAKYPSDAFVKTPILGSQVSEEQAPYMYISGTNITGVNASEKIALYEVETVTGKVVKFVAIQLNAVDFAIQIAGTASDSVVLMQEGNTTVTAGDVFIFTLTSGTLKDTTALQALGATNVITLSLLPAGMTYTVENIGGNLVVTFNNPATYPIGANVEMNAVIKAAAVAEAGAHDSGNISVTLQKSNIYSMTYSYGTYRYVLEGGNATIIGYNDNPGDNTTDITIPNSLNGYDVRGIGTGAFWNMATKNDIHILRLSSNITNIETSAFNSCGITELYIPDNVTIASLAFIGNNIEKIVIGKDVIIGNNMLDGNNNSFRDAYTNSITGGEGTYVYVNGEWIKEF